MVGSLSLQLAGIHDWSMAMTTTFVAGLLGQWSLTITALFVGAPGAREELRRAQDTAIMAQSTAKAAIAALPPQ